MIDARQRARQKEYTWQTVVTIVLYLNGYLPGLIANLLFLEDVKRTEALAGIELPGTGLLKGLIQFQVQLAAVLAIGLLIGLLCMLVFRPW